MARFGMSGTLNAPLGNHFLLGEIIYRFAVLAIGVRCSLASQGERFPQSFGSRPRLIDLYQQVVLF